MFKTHHKATRTSAAALVGLLSSYCAVAAADENDILICQVIGSPSDLATGQIDTLNGQLQVPVRVYSESTEIAGSDDWRGDEGFFAVSDPSSLPSGYTSLAPNTDITFTLRSFAVGAASSNLWYWDPAANAQPTFVPASGGQRLSYRKSPTQFFNATVDGSAVDVPGFTIDRVSSTGLLHRHLTLVLDDGDTDPLTPVRTGIYVVSLQLNIGSEAAPPVYEVINGGMGAAGDAAQLAAVQYFTQLLNPPPCPGDLDGDRAVSLTDLAILLANFGVGSGATRAQGDLNGDGAVNLTDLASLLASFGSSCP